MAERVPPRIGPPRLSSMILATDAREASEYTYVFQPMATWSGVAPGGGMAWIVTPTFGPGRLHPPAQPSRTVTRSSSRRRATSSRRATAIPAASSRRLGPPGTAASVTWPASRGQTVMTSRRETPGRGDGGNVPRVPGVFPAFDVLAMGVSSAEHSASGRPGNLAGPGSRVGLAAGTVEPGPIRADTSGRAGSQERQRR